MKIFKTKNGILYNGECKSIISKYIKNDSLDLVVTSPPYNVNINYDEYNDNLSFIDYMKNMKLIFQFIYNKLKDDGRIAINILYESKVPKDNMRVFFASEFWMMLKDIGFKWAGLVDIKEPSPERVKLTAWGSYLKASAPYIYNPKECILICYKNKWKKNKKGISTIDKKEFIEVTGGIWSCKPETRGLTKSNFSLDLPLKVLKILSYENDLILDPFAGSCTTPLACEILNRKWIGIELSKNYFNIGLKRIKNYVNMKKTIEMFFKN